MHNASEAPVAKVPSGIAGFDLISHGGLPRARVSALLGGPGSGKTVFALQTLVQGGLLGEPGVFVAFEETPERIIANCQSFGWNLSKWLAPQRPRRTPMLAFIEANLSPHVVQAGAFDLVGLLAAVGAQCAAIGAKRVVFDGIDVLLSALNDAHAERVELHRIHQWLVAQELTAILTAKSEHDGGTENPYGILQFMVDCLVQFDSRYVEGVSVCRLRIVKYRGSGFDRNEAPYTIGPDGIDVAGGGPPTLERVASTVRVSTGVERLDNMLAGGYFKGSVALIGGAPGTAKSTLGGAFAAAACRRGDSSVYISFDESPEEMSRNLASVGIQLQPHLKSGLLTMHSIRPDLTSADELFVRVASLIRTHNPACLVIDPLSAITHAGGTATATAVVQRLLGETKRRGITTVCTTLLDNGNGELEGTPIGVSTYADTWIHLSYVVRGGERNRALTIIKSRGTKHSNQVRELILSNTGLTLTDVYTAGGEVLMGTARWQRENDAVQEREKNRAALTRRRRELQAAAHEIETRAEQLRRELSACRAEMEALSDEESAREARWQTQQTELRLRRDGTVDEIKRKVPNRRAAGHTP